ncbi:MAG: sigma 54-interacting transcriptional regulator [Deltaproteobacteria bacterium]|nr:sigma 54-interacting transcriptional regulator [Deltaproteobacteria bacterium]
MTETVELGGLKGQGPLPFILLVPRATGPERVPIEGTLLVGKHPSNDVVIDDTGISRYHLEIRAEPDRVLVRDVGSKNGTFYDGARITEVRVGPGAKVRVGGPAGLELAIELAMQPVFAPSEATHFGPLLGHSRAMRTVFTILERAAPSAATILVHGETGTGKELVAQAIHQASPRRAGPFVVIDCGAIPHQLIESELFGHRRGAFTDAHEDRKGAFELAHGGTLFLDEIGELPIDLQPKLLRAVESRTIQRVGDGQRREVDVRLIAATHRDLAGEVTQKRFRQDLYFRLAVVTVHLPPLRERSDDVLHLARHILEQLGSPGLLEQDPSIRESLLSYGWPGNVRELRNAIERAIHLGAEHAIPRVAGPTSSPHQRPLESSPEPNSPDLPFKEAKEQIISGFERIYVARLMERHGGNISAAAREAGIDRNYLYRLLKKHELEH